MRNIVQIASGDCITALCDDGTVWQLKEKEWQLLPGIPQVVTFPAWEAAVARVLADSGIEQKFVAAMLSSHNDTLTKKYEAKATAWEAANWVGEQYTDLDKFRA